ncbi:ABC transporter substrate-binding protein [Bradyrhizobium yuanmingense]|uniref:ABC transporter substrate-binding protein n=1 Tax=Bradyrhizobium yuanmingense TaxID=108015 RepID=UPI0023BA2D8D|nr:ABC transporter substrate-binding protein [Bradyrhizobium yuanmingense]MDF0495150.1 ABC transporter substrate-binding protein [Bradyrhizobium yuanmingense]
MKQGWCWLAALSIAFGSLVAAQPVGAQQAEKTYRVGILCGGCNDQEAPSRLEPIREALRERGYVEGRNIEFVYRSAEGRYDKLPDLAADLVRAKVDVIMAGGGLPGALAAKNATTTIPVIFVGIGEDPVQHGLVSSLSRPGGNVTGLVDRYADLIPKQLNLLKEAVPSVSRVGVLWDARLRQALEPSFQAMQTALPSLGLQHYAIAVNGPDDLPDAFRAASRARVEALILFPSPKFNIHLAEIARMTAEQKIPAISGFTDFARTGGFLSYGPDSKKTWRYAAISVDKIFKGTSPADIPVEQSDNIVLVVNLQTARALGLIVPQALLVSANEIID